MADRPEENLKLDIEVAQKVMGWHHDPDWTDWEAWWFDNPEHKGEPLYLPFFSTERTPAYLVLRRIRELDLRVPFAILLSYRAVGPEHWDTLEDVATLLMLCQGEVIAHIGYWHLFNLIGIDPVHICNTALRVVEWSKNQSA